MASRLISGLALAPEEALLWGLEEGARAERSREIERLRICLALLATPEPHVGEANEDPLQEHEA